MTLLALMVFGWDLASESHFMDESAYLSQAFYADLWVDGEWNHPAWLDYAGYDLPPLPKYLIGWSLRVSGYRRFNSKAAWEWYANPSRRFGSLGALVAARRPSVALGVVGCLAIYALGTLGFDRRVGFGSGLLLMANPLYRMHARRAMSDVPAEALILASAAVGLWAWRRLVAGHSGLMPMLVLVFGSGTLGGLATLAKLNGALAGFILADWAVLALVLPGPSRRSKALLVAATLASGVVSFGTFVALNPFLTARPKGPIDPRLAPVANLSFVGRVRAVAEHRSDVSTNAPSLFPRDALTTPRDKIEAVAVQGFGRFGPFGPMGRTDSTIRFDPRQDWGVKVWMPWVALGLVVALLKGRAQNEANEPPTAWAIASQAIVALSVVTAFIPLAWDRYFLSIQAGSAILAACAAVAAFDGVHRVFARKGAVR